MNRTVDVVVLGIAVPICIALTLVLIAALIAGALLRVLRFLGIVSGRLLDEAEAFRATFPRKFTGKPRR